MKAKMTALSCIAIVAMMILPISALATMTMRLSAWTDDIEYTHPDTVQIYAVWSISDMNFDHDKCDVTLIVWKDNEVPPIDTFSGSYEPPPGSGQSGDIDLVSCDNWLGSVEHDWDTTGTGYYNVEVLVTAYDSSQSPPDDEIFGQELTNQFQVV